MTFLIQFDEFDEGLVKIYFKCRISFELGNLRNVVGHGMAYQGMWQRSQCPGL
jgi:hypothetical protein